MGLCPRRSTLHLLTGCPRQSQLLSVLATATPQAIVPARKIGELREDYAASFLALDGNPIDSLENIKRISVRVKDGNVIEVRPEAFSTITYPRSRRQLPQRCSSQEQGEIRFQIPGWNDRRFSRR
jgi:hypothetical protein